MDRWSKDGYDYEYVRWPSIYDSNARCVACSNDHSAVAECIKAAHGLRRVDRWASEDVRFQHGDNPEHSKVITRTEFLNQDKCLGGVVDAWLQTIHARAASSPD